MGRCDDLIVYQKAFDLAIEIYKETKNFPKEDKMGIVSQIRRSSAAVCAILAECYGRRHHQKYFLLKLQEMAGENAETQVWLDMSVRLELITNKAFIDFTNRNQEVGRLIRFMLSNPQKFN